MKFYNFYKRYGIYTLLVVIFVFFCVFCRHFFTMSNILNILRQVSIFGTVVVGVSFVMIGGGADLSVGGQVAVEGILVALLMTELNLPIWLCMTICLLVGALIGLLNGFLTVTFHIPAFIVTLGMMLILSGLAYVVSGGIAIFGIPSEYSWIGQGYVGSIPIPVIIFAVITAIGWIVLSKTYFGRHIYATGGNAEAAVLSGIEVKKITLIAFTICGVTAALAALMQLSRSNSAQPGAGSSYPFDCMTAAVLGGISMSGGKGKISGAVVGVLILGILNNGLQMMNCDANLVDVIKGIILLFAIGIDCMNNNKSSVSAKLKA